MWDHIELYCVAGGAIAGTIIGRLVEEKGKYTRTSLGFGLGGILGYFAPALLAPSVPPPRQLALYDVMELMTSEQQQQLTQKLVEAVQEAGVKAVRRVVMDTPDEFIQAFFRITANQFSN